MLQSKHFTKQKVPCHITQILYINTLFCIAICDTLTSEVDKIKDDPKPDKVRQALLAACSGGYGEFDRKFPFEFMQSITSHQLNFQKPNVGKTVDSWLRFVTYTPEQISDFALKFSKGLEHTFTLRHYAGSNTHKSVKSNFALWNERVITTSNTAAKDWSALGNTAFTFWWFCIDGVVPTKDRGFIQQAKYYDEIALDDESLKNKGLEDVEFFASSDLMKHAESYPTAVEKPVLLRGKIKDIAEIIFGYLVNAGKTSKVQLNTYKTSSHAQIMLDLIDASFPVFEVKIPGTVKNPNWQAKSK